MTRVLVLAIASLCAGLAVMAQTPAERMLDLKRAELAESQARAAYEQVRELHEKGIESRFALERARADLDRAQLETARARTALANELPALRVVSATKSVDANGDALVTLRVAEMEYGYDPSIQRRYLVSLMNEASIISDPYQTPLTFSGPRASASTLNFRLLSDVDSVSVVVNSGSRKEVIPILLRRSVTANRLRLTAANFSQDGALGGKVEYAVTVERFSRQANDIELAVEGLPETFTFEWVDTASGAKLSRLRFPGSLDSAKLTLRLLMPEEVPRELFNTIVPFQVVAFGGAAREVRWGELALQVRPVGTPKLAITAGNLLIPIAPGGTRRVTVDVENTGGTVAEGVALQADFPLGFRGGFAPASLSEIRPHERKQIEIVVTALPDALPGEYAVKVKAITAARAGTDSPELSFRIDLQDAKSKLWTSLGIAALIAGVAVAIVLLSRSMRR